MKKIRVFVHNINNGMSKWWNHRVISHWPVNTDSRYLPRDKKPWARTLPRHSLHLWLRFAEVGPCHFCSLPSCLFLWRCLHTEARETVVCAHSSQKQLSRLWWWQTGARSPPERPVTGEKNNKIEINQKSRKKQRGNSMMNEKEIVLYLPALSEWWCLTWWRVSAWWCSLWNCQSQTHRCHFLQHRHMEVLTWQN